MARFDQLFQQRLRGLANRNLYRSLTPVAIKERSLQEPAAFIDLASNDALKLSYHPKLCLRAAEWADRFGVGSGASRLVTGTRQEHLEVEQKIAAFSGSESALLFTSGWQANASVLPALLQFSRDHTGHTPLVFADKSIHASLYHGARAGEARLIRFRHQDLDQLESLLKRFEDIPGHRYILSETIFSMEGDATDVATLKQLSEQHGAFLFLDEAHAVGLYGPSGRGLAYAHAPDLVIGTLSKAFGTMGAYVAGSSQLCRWLINSCSGFIYTTAPPPPVLGAIDAALDLMPELDFEREQLMARSKHLRFLINDFGLKTTSSGTHIVPIYLQSSEQAVTLARRLRQDNILVAAIRPPTVPPHTARLRLSVNVELTELDLSHVVSKIHDLVENA